MFNAKDLAVGIASVLLGLLILWQSSGLVAKTSMDPAGPAALPVMMAWVLVVLGAVNALGGLAFLVSAKDRPKKGFLPAFRQFFEDYRLVIIVIIIGAAFCALFDFLGYLIAVPLMFAAILWFMGKRDLKSLLGINLAITAILFVAFRFGLSVDLPLGPFGMLFQ